MKRRPVIAIWVALALIVVAAIAEKRIFLKAVSRGIGAIDHGPIERLWTGSAPGSLGTSDADVPAISVYLPARWHSTGAAMVICPGGAYKLLMSSYEGEDIARWLNSFGVAAFVLRYRIAPRYRHPTPMLDAARAIRFVRYNAARYGLRPDRIGIIGFSAGGHLASTIITHFDDGDASSADPVDRISSRPDFAVLGYPIVTLEQPFTHSESLHNLLGPNPDAALIGELSNDRHVTSRTPPTFLFHTAEDAAVPVENSLLFYSALRRNGVESALHVFQFGPHGAGMANGYGRAPFVPSLRPWSALAEQWLSARWPHDGTWSYSALFRI